MFKSNEHTLNWQESYYSFDALNYSRNEIFSPSPGGTTIGCQRGPSAPRAPSAQTWFCTLRISLRRKAGWDRSCQGGRNLFRQSETSAERKGWAATIFLPRRIFLSWFLHRWVRTSWLQSTFPCSAMTTSRNWNEFTKKILKCLVILGLSNKSKRELI